MGGDSFSQALVHKFTKSFWRGDIMPYIYAA